MSHFIDGSVYEGGGSILRVAVPLAAAMGDKIDVYNIRKNRKKPGLRLQHLLGLQILKELTGGELIGGEIGSEQISFQPGSSSVSQIYMDVSTAASLPLVIQTLIHFVSASRRSVYVKFNGGGTHTKWAPPLEYLEYVTAPALKNFGVSLKLDVNKFGFFPKGGAELSVQLTASAVHKPLSLITQPHRSNWKLYVSCSEALENRRIPERIHGVLHKKIGCELISKYREAPPGVAATLVLEGNPPLGYSVIGERGLSSEKIGEVLSSSSGNGVMDEYLSDQLLVPLAFSPIGSQILVHKNQHVLANLHVIKMIRDVLEVEEKGNYLKITNVGSNKSNN